MRMRPWKAPVVNVVDMLVSTSLLLLIGSAIKKETGLWDLGLNSGPPLDSVFFGTVDWN